MWVIVLFGIENMMNDVWIDFWWWKLCIIWKWVFVINYEHGVLIEDKIVWLYGGDELGANWLGLILVSCRGCWWNPRLWLFGYWCGKFDVSGEIKCRHDRPTLRLKGQLVMSWACVIGSSRDRDQKVDPGGWKRKCCRLDGRHTQAGASWDQPSCDGVVETHE